MCTSYRQYTNDRSLSVELPFISLHFVLLVPSLMDKAAYLRMSELNRAT